MSRLFCQDFIRLFQAFVALPVTILNRQLGDKETMATNFSNVHRLISIEAKYGRQLPVIKICRLRHEIFIRITHQNELYSVFFSTCFSCEI